MSEEFENKLKRWRFYAKQYWKLKNQAMLLEADVSYEYNTSFCSDCPGRDGNCCKERDYYEEHWSDREFKMFKKLLDFCQRHSTQEMIEVSRPLNHGGVRDIVDLVFPPEVYTDVIRPY